MMRRFIALTILAGGLVLASALLCPDAARGGDCGAGGCGLRSRSVSRPGFPFGCRRVHVQSRGGLLGFGILGGQRHVERR